MSVRITASNGMCPCKACQRPGRSRGWAWRARERAIAEGVIEALPRKKRRRAR